MRADPKPEEPVLLGRGERSVTGGSNAYGIDLADFLEPQRRGSRIFAPKPIGAARCGANFGIEETVTCPKVSGR